MLYYNLLSTFVVCLEDGEMLTVHQGQAARPGDEHALGGGAGLAAQ